MKYSLLIPLSLFICTYANADISSFFLDIEQMDRYGENYRENILKEICQSKNEHNLVIIKAVNNNGELNDKLLDQVAPYYKCFNKVFFSVDSKKWKRSSADWKDTKYYNGIMDKTFVQENIDYALENANLIKRIYPKMNLNWYIHYESNLNYLKNDSVKDGYEYYLRTLSDSLYKIKSGDILWSPAFWTPYNKLTEKDKSKLEKNLNNLFKETPKLTWVNFQDVLGQTSYTTCNTFTCNQINTISNKNFKTQDNACMNTKGNYQLMQQAIKNTNIKNMKVTMELYTTRNDTKVSFLPAPKKTIIDREKCYNDNNIPIGISFELLYWSYLKNS
ncbi:hypothetical protein [Acinetobacter higginsii]|uniref:hypothetical protein n=1 Tax=Acinetobacter higginsii TaxID=70347 RepID=UPI001F4AF730|nr:hypothetical protein [Acinetobacter higginsii]MCH7340610.1 hypothetical protein [Acinetobacter higginsii]